MVHLRAKNLVIGAAMPMRRERKPKRPSFAVMVRQAQKAGLEIVGETWMPDGTVSLIFGKATKIENEITTDPDDELARWRRKKGHAN